MTEQKTRKKIPEFLSLAAQQQASDIFIIAGRPLSIKKDGKLIDYGERLMPEHTAELIHHIYDLADNRDIRCLTDRGDDDFSFSIPGLSRFRVNAYRQRGSLAAVIRVIAFELPDPERLHIPKEVMDTSEFTKGLVLVTGPAGSGKSTTMACLIDRINHTREGHIITLEDPLEYLHRHDKCIVSQREICTDTHSYLVSLRATLRQSPDVILLGEMRDYETIQTAMTAAETGHLILSSLHTIGAANTIGRIMDVFDPSQQHQIAIQLSMVLQAVISQQLIPDVDGHIIPVFEIMRLTPAIRNMIRDSKVHQIDGVISSSTQGQMKSMDQSLLELYKKGAITKEKALKYASNEEMLKRKL
ncbi:MAG: PilT/PilU family type 4a pilus ATPase [Eubacteriales bacterium]|nr:PilT/PilU family type 4a pilus ATPase [Eubacteriales bacterium]